MTDELKALARILHTRMPRAWEDDYLQRNKQWDEDVAAVAQWVYEHNKLVSPELFTAHCNSVR